MNIVVVTLNDPDDWSDHKSIYENIFNKYKSYQVINKDNFKIDKEDYYKKDKLYVKNNYNITLTKDELKSVSLNYNLMRLNDYVDDTLVGYIEVMIDKTIYHKEPIYVEKAKKEKNLNWWQKFKGWLHTW